MIYTLHPFDIPLIQSDVASHLACRDLASCCGVNKAWRAIFSPLLWKTVNTSLNPFSTFSFSNPDFEVALKRNRAHVQSLILSHYINVPPFVCSYPRLTALSVAIVGGIQFGELAQLIECNPTIDTLTLSIKTCLDRKSWAVFNQLPNLRRLSLTIIYASLDDDVLINILSKCPRLERFRLDCGSSCYDRSSARDISTLLATNLPSRLALQEIDFVGLFWDFVLLLLPYCPHLVKFTIPPLDAVVLERLCQTLQETEFPQLAVLDFARFRNMKSETFARIILSCSHLALKRVHLVWGFTNKVALNALWRHHGASLEDLRITRCMDDITSHDLVDVVTSCPSLKALHLESWSDSVSLLANDLVSAANSCDFTKWPMPRWACYNLVELRIVIKGLCTRPKYCSVHEDCQKLQNEVYRLFSQLRHLRILDVGCRPGISRGGLREKGGLEWTLASGMDQLHTLRGLEELSARHMANGLGVPELEWMKEHWPRLCCIEGFIGGRDTEYEAETWLRERWPTLSWS